MADSKTYDSKTRRTVHNDQADLILQRYTAALLAEARTGKESDRIERCNPELKPLFKAEKKRINAAIRAWYHEGWDKQAS